MDLGVIGKFIASQRKTCGLTQVQLAEKINVSEKTISKWETGKGFPDTTLMLPLCKELKITANELLSGKLLPTENEYKEIAEKNLVELKAKQEKSDKLMLSLEWSISTLSIVFLLTMSMVASYCQMSEGWRIALIIWGVLNCLVGVHFCLIIEQRAGYYECGHCHHKYVPTYKQVLWAPHMGRTRLMKCPSCNKKSWHKKTTNQEDNK